MSSISVFSKETLESVVSWAEVFTFVFTFIGAFSGVAYLMFNRPLKKIEARERREAEQRFEELKGKNLELQKSLAPRDISALDPRDTAKFDEFISKRNALQKFSGIEVSFEVIPEFEARRTANLLKQMVEQIGWKVVSTKTEEGIRDGVIIWRHLSPDLASAIAGDANEIRSEGAANSLAECLKFLNWQVDVEMGARLPSSVLNVPPNNVRIQVGFKPAPFFEPEWVRKMRVKADEMREKSKHQ